MLLEITHDTRYAYDPDVEIAQHFAHLKPADLETQRVLKSEVQVSPRPSWSEENIDSHGNVWLISRLVDRYWMQQLI